MENKFGHIPDIISSHKLINKIIVIYSCTNSSTHSKNKKRGQILEMYKFFVSFLSINKSWNGLIRYLLAIVVYEKKKATV